MKPGESTRRVIAAACVLGVLAAPTAARALAHQANTASVPVAVKTTQTYTGTGVRLRAGESVTVRAAGRITFQAGASTNPNGIEWGKKCTQIAGSASAVPWPAPGKRCWSLIGRVGSSPPFEIGTAKTFKAPNAGELFLGINDNHVGDNRGAWTAAVNRVAPTSPGTSGVVPRQGTSKASKKSSPLLPILLGVALLIVAGLLIFWLVRRRRGTKDDAAPVAAPAGARASRLVAQGVDSAPLTPTAPPEPLSGPAAVPFDKTSSDVNIFQVDVSTLGTVRVGYSFFPEGTVVRWRVAENGAPLDSGQFTAEGGGSAKHFVKLPIAGGLAPGATGIDVHFHWDIAEVPFDYSVRRDPGT
ncbi:MAG: hypothetical protein QOF59_791 [Actinomycetota bacterium]|nr:hypothetical protein [Actinomycetota bacterium]MDQ1477410.1 hypothetical protein [Actinomycetota bacterium]